MKVHRVSRQLKISGTYKATVAFFIDPYDAEEFAKEWIETDKARAIIEEVKIFEERG